MQGNLPNMGLPKDRDIFLTKFEMSSIQISRCSAFRIWLACNLGGNV